MLGAIYWDPPTTAFTIPYLEHPIVWYGILFVAGLLLGYCVVRKMFRDLFIEHAVPNPLQSADSLLEITTFVVVAGTLIGARLGFILFYAPDYYFNHPIEIFKTWKGGLASHGAAIGIILAMYLLSFYTRRRLQALTFIRMIDIIAIPTPLAGFFIRMGNFMNQEILGTPSSAPWAVVFGHPADGSLPIARHPVVLYEGAVYLFLFFFLYSLWNRFGLKLRAGTYSGIFLIVTFTARFILEFWKTPQDGIMQDSFLQTGQYLSLPFILLGVGLYFYGSGFKNER